MSKASDILERHLCEMSIRLEKDDTGLDYDIWCPADADIKKKAAPYIKVALTPTSNFNHKDSVGVTINDNPSFLQTKDSDIKKDNLVSGKYFNKLKKFILLNKLDLIKHWNGKLSDAKLLASIKKV